MPTYQELSSITLIALIILVILVLLDCLERDRNRMLQVRKQMKKQLIHLGAETNLEKSMLSKTINDMVQDNLRDEKSQFKQILRSCVGGFTRGMLIGYIIGGPDSALGGGIVFGLANPLIEYGQDIYMPDDNLIR